MTRALNLTMTLLFFMPMAYAFPTEALSRKHRRPTIQEKIISQGVPSPAVKKVLSFLTNNAGKRVHVQAKIRPAEGPAYMAEKSIIVKNDFATIIDFSKPSEKRRLYLINLKTGSVEKYLVAHGKGSGVRKAVRFSNEEGSKMSSLGLFLGGNPYYGGNGQSLNLFGLEKTNDAAASRDIVFHAAPYATAEFIEKEGRLGRSWGCPAVGPTIIGKILRYLKDGRVVYGYHPDLLNDSKAHLFHFNQDDLEEDIDLPGEEETLQNEKATFQWPF